MVDVGIEAPMYLLRKIYIYINEMSKRKSLASLRIGYVRLLSDWFFPRIGQAVDNDGACLGSRQINITMLYYCQSGEWALQLERNPRKTQASPNYVVVGVLYSR